MCHIARDTPLLVSLRQIQNLCHNVVRCDGRHIGCDAPPLVLPCQIQNFRHNAVLQDHVPSYQVRKITHLRPPKPKRRLSVLALLPVALLTASLNRR